MSPLAHLHIFPSQLIWSNSPGPLLRGCTYCLCKPLADRSFPEFAQLSFSIRLHLHLCPSLFALAPLNCYQCALSRSCYQRALLWVGFSRECGGNGEICLRGFLRFRGIHDLPSAASTWNRNARNARVPHASPVLPEVQLEPPIPRE